MFAPLVPAILAQHLNVLRTGRKGLAALTLIADILKGFLVVWFFKQGMLEAGLVAGLGAFVGHLFPVWLRFKGGKGIAVYVGVLAAVSSSGFIIGAIVWFSVAILTRYSSLAALALSSNCTTFYLVL